MKLFFVNVFDKQDIYNLLKRFEQAFWFNEPISAHMKSNSLLLPRSADLHILAPLESTLVTLVWSRNIERPLIVMSPTFLKFIVIDISVSKFVQVYNALGVSYVRDGKTDKGISQLETAVKIQPGYVTAWNNLGDAYEKKKDYKAALKAFEEALLFDPNNKLARPRRDALKDKVQMYKGIPLKGKQR